MSKLYKISVLILAIGLSWPTNGETASSTGSEITQAQSPSSALPHFASNAFSVHQPAENATSVANNLPTPTSVEDSQDHTFEYFFVESTNQKHAAIYLFACRVIDHSLSITKIIFPFHFFF